MPKAYSYTQRGNKLPGRFELFEPGGRVFKAPGTSLRWIKNVLDKVKRDLGNSPLRIDPLNR
jgi:hypothetical protein